MEKHKPTTRFSDRVACYVKYRPGYPDQIYDHLLQHAGLVRDHWIADLGSGTGLLSRLFLDHGHRLIAIEPNPEMRSAAETLLADQGGFTSLAGRAEEIPLPDDSIDFVAAGQAFHWFEPRATRREINRVLKPGRQAALIWNTRDEDNPFIQAYEGLLLDCGIDYAQVDQQRVVTDQIINEFFSPEVPIRATFPNQQIFDYEGLLGRLLSSSYMPQEGHPHYAKMEASLGKIFRENQRDGRILFPYLTVVYHAPVPKPA